jgi:AcrR family transcriptional regulator
MYATAGTNAVTRSEAGPAESAVATPWGSSDSLRERRLRPARGTPAAEVERNQRERLFAALVACLERKGYAATTVADLAAVSGVSSRTFYDLFGDKARCLRETIEAIVSMAAVERVISVDAPLEDWLGQCYQAFATALVDQPAAAKVCLSEVRVAGGPALEPLNAVVARFERELAGRLEADPERRGMPPQVISARLGGVLEIARARLRSGREGELAGLGEELVSLLVADRPPPEPLRLGVRPRRAEPESLAAPGHAERAIRAFAVLVAERGFAATTVADVVKRASMSASTFYANLHGKEDLMMAAIDTTCAQAVAAVVPAFSRDVEWPEAVRAAYGALFDFLASRPALGRLVTVDVYAAGEAALVRRNEGLEPLRALFEINTSEWVSMPPAVYEVLGTGVQQLLYKTVSQSGVEALPGLAPICTYLTLSPFIGVDAACTVANGAGGGGQGQAARWTPGQSAAIPFAAPQRMAVVRTLDFLEARPATAREIGAAVGEDAVVVAHYMADLAALGAIEELDDGGDEPRYVYVPMHKLAAVTAEQAARMSRSEREELVMAIWDRIGADLDRSRQSGAFDRRHDWTLIRAPMRLDEAGWRELADLHAQSLHESFAIQARSTRRLAESDARPIEVRSAQLAFEMPPRGDDAGERQSEEGEDI